jgi:hypothetical protein
MAFEHDCIERLMALWCRELAANGFDRDQINEILAQRAPEIERWRQQTLAQIARFVDEPDAPTVELQ